MSHALRVAWFRYRASFRRRWVGYLTIVVLIGSVGGVALASLAGARRTESSLPTFVTSTNPSTLAMMTTYDDPALGVNSGYNPTVDAEIARLPFVARSTSAIIFDANIKLSGVKGIHPHFLAGETPPTVIGSTDGEFSQVDRVTLVRGRLANPHRRNQAEVNLQAARELGLHIGSVIQIPFYTDKQAQVGTPFLVENIRIVGEIVLANNVVESDFDALGSPTMILSPALTRALLPQCATGTEVFLQLRGGDRSANPLLADVNRVDPDVTKFGGDQVTSSFVSPAQQAIEPEAIALAVFGGIAGLSVILISGLMIGRVLRAESEETRILRALGASRLTMLTDHVLAVLTAVLLGSVVAVAVAYFLSPLAPLGPVRPVYPSPGLAFDWSALGFGFLILLFALTALTLIFSLRTVQRVTNGRRVGPPPREGHLVRLSANSSLPISVVAGVRFALESNRGRTAAPVRSAILGTVLAITVLVATLTFGASLSGLVSHPSQYGWNWNYALLSAFAGAEDLPAHQSAVFLKEDRDVLSWSGVYTAGASIDGQGVAILAERPGARVSPPILTGHGLQKADQIVLGSTTLAQLHKRVGETVTFDNTSSKPVQLLIVGTATMPAIEDGLGMGSGAIVSSSDYPTSLLNIQDNPIPGPNAILVRTRPNVAPSAAYRSLEKVNQQINAVPGADGPAGGVVTVLRPVEIVNFHSMGTTPTIFAGSLALGAITALGITLGASVRRRRRDLALLKALGFTQRQLRAAIAWQATVAAVIGTLFGLPLGIVIGRELWTLFARSIDAVPSPTVPALWTVVVGLGALVFANLVAAVPGRIAARTSTALVLRAE
ncbi:MAG: FtsX-like permease family protein [Acidimicrobiales bacterium]